MDTKPELIRLEPVDPNTLPGANMYIKNEVLYHVASPAHHIKKEEPKVYYDENNHSTLHLSNIKSPYIPDAVQSFPSSKPISQYPKYQTPKLRAKSTYSPMKPVSQSPQMYMKTEQAEIMIDHMGVNHHIPDRSTEHNTVQVITPNANYAPQQWTSDVTMTPIMEQSLPSEMVGGQSLAPEAIFIPESNVLSTETGDYGGLNTSTINFIPVMTPNGLMLVAANNTAPTTVLSGLSQGPSNEIVNNPTPPQAKTFNRRKPAKRNSTAAQQAAMVTPEMEAAANTSNVIYSPNCPVLILNETQEQHTPYKELTQIPEKIPQKGTVIEEPPKAIYQPRQFTGSDINENSTQYNSKKGRNMNSRGNTSTAQFDAELDLDAALTVFKIYK